MIEYSYILFYLCGRSILLSLCIKCPVVVWIEREDNHLVIWLANGDTIQTPKTAFETSWVNKRALYLQDVHIVHSNNKNENYNPSFIAEYINSCRLRNSMLGIGEWTYLVQIVPLFCYTWANFFFLYRENKIDKFLSFLY